MGADSLAENTQNAPEFICPICLPKPKSLAFQWKKASLGVRCPLVRSMNSHLALIFFKVWLHATQSTLLLKLKNSAPTYHCRCHRHHRRRRRPPPPGPSGTGGKGKIMVESQKPICSLTLPCPANTQVCVQGECFDFELSNDIWIVATVALAALFMVRGKKIIYRISANCFRGNYSFF